MIQLSKVLLLIVHTTVKMVLLEVGPDVGRQWVDPSGRSRGPGNVISPEVIVDLLKYRRSDKRSGVFFKTAILPCQCERDVSSMSKQSSRLRTRQERRREDMHQREEERRRAARTKRITIVSIFAAGVLVVAALIYLVMAQGQTPVNAAYPLIDGVSCDGLEHSDFHIHAHISIYIDGKPAPIPAQIGIAPDTSCLYWLHTHTSDGVIHIEAPNGLSITLKNFLDIWGERFPQLNYPSQLSDPAGWQTYVNGKPYTGNFQTIPLQSHTLITLAYNSPGIRPDTTFGWNGL